MKYEYLLLEDEGDDGTGSPCMVLTRYSTDDLLDVIRSSFTMHHDAIMRVDESTGDQQRIVIPQIIASYDQFVAAAQLLRAPRPLTLYERAEVYLGLAQLPESP